MKTLLEDEATASFSKFLSSVQVWESLRYGPCLSPCPIQDLECWRDGDGWFVRMIGTIPHWMVSAVALCQAKHRDVLWIVRMLCFSCRRHDADVRKELGFNERATRGVWWSLPSFPQRGSSSALSDG